MQSKSKHSAGAKCSSVGLAFLLASSVVVRSSTVEAVDLCYTGTTTAPGFTLNGDAVLVSGGGLQLTSESLNQRGSLFYNTPLSTSSDIRVFFTIEIETLLGSPADGIAFVMQNAATGASTVGTSGGGIGYGGVSPSVVVEFDTYANPTDPNGNHIGITLNGDSTMHIGGAVTPAFTMSMSRFNVWIDYTSSPHTLAVFVSEGASKPGTALLTRTLDLATQLGPSLYMGFTGSTGGSRSRHRVPFFVATDSAIVDTDNDGAVNSCDTDDDNDCLPDTSDPLPLNPSLPSSAHCDSGAPACTVLPIAPLVGSCVQCTSSMSAACTGATPHCSSATNTCTACPVCLGATPVCNTVTHACVGCLNNSQCNSGTPYCNAASNVCELGTITIVSPANGVTTHSRTPLISGSATPGQTVQVSVNGATLTTTADATTGLWSVTPTSPLPMGNITVTASIPPQGGSMPSVMRSFVVGCASASDCMIGQVCDITTGACVAQSVDGGAVDASFADTAAMDAISSDGDIPADAVASDVISSDVSSNDVSSTTDAGDAMVLDGGMRDGLDVRYSGTGVCNCSVIGARSETGDMRLLWLAMGSLAVVMTRRRRGVESKVS